MKITALSADTVDVVTRTEPDNATPHRGLDLIIKLGEQSAGKNGASTTASQDTEDISLQKLQNVTEAMDAYMSSLGVNLKFNIDERTDTVQVEVRDPETDKVIRKIPADEMLELAASIEKMVGVFLDKAL